MLYFYLVQHEKRLSVNQPFSSFKMACSRRSDNGEWRKKQSGGGKAALLRCFFPAHFSLHRPSQLSELRSNLYFNLSSEIPEQSPLLKDDKCTLSSSVHLSTLLQWPAVIEKKNTQANFQHFILPSKSFYSKFR